MGGSQRAVSKVRSRRRVSVQHRDSFNTRKAGPKSPAAGRVGGLKEVFRRGFRWRPLSSTKRSQLGYLLRVSEGQGSSELRRFRGLRSIAHPKSNKLQRSIQPALCFSVYKQKDIKMKRRNLLKALPAAAAGIASTLSGPGPLEAAQAAARRGMPPLTITDVKIISTAPTDSNWTIVKVMTSEPGLYGLGSATHQ